MVREHLLAKSYRHEAIGILQRHQGFLLESVISSWLALSGDLPVRLRRRRLTKKPIQ